MPLTSTLICEMNLTGRTLSQRKKKVKIKGMYNEIDKDDFAKLVFKPVDEFDLTWDEIERDGGIAQVNKDLAETYNV